jgi:methyl-accepting chemotaxis protein
MKFTGLEELLKADIGEDEKLKILASQYTERLKEQKLLLDSTRILGDTSLSLEDAIRRVLRDIPDAFQYPDICEASFEYTTVQEKTGKFKNTPWSLSVEMTASDGHPCVLEIVYLEEMPPMDEGPFLKEERALIDALGDIFLAAVNRAILMHDVNQQAHESRLMQRKAEFIIQNAPVPIFEINHDLSIVKTNSAYAQVTGISTERLLKMNLSEITVTKRTGRTAREAIDMKTVLSGELELDVPAGQKVLEYLYLPILDDNGDVLSVINFYVDKTAEKTAVRDIISLTHAAKAGQLDTRVDPDKYEGDLLLLAKGINDTLDAVIGPLNVAAEYVDRISKGDIPPKITDSYSGDFNEIKNNLNQCIDAVSLLVDDAGLLSVAAVEGKLDTRADATKHQGAFRKIVEGVNATLDAVIGPLNVAAEYVDRISKGDIPPKITDAYSGDFNEIKNNLNQCIEAVNLLISDAGLLAGAAVEGKLDTRADASKHQGDFREIVEGVNSTLDAVIGPLNVAAEYVDRISKGDIPPKITDSYNGDFNEIKNNLNQCIDGLQGLVEANRSLQRMSINDHTLRMTGSYQGVFAEVASAVNAVQDRVNHVAGSIEKISHGDLSELPEYREVKRRSEQDRIVPGFIKTLETLQALADDAGMLSKAAVEGHLDTRADATRHEGEFRTIVEGVNATLDAVIGPLNVAAEYVDRISKGDIPPKITDSYNGDFNEIKNNLNQCIEAVNLLISDSNLLASAAVGGHLDTRADATKHQGDFRTIVEGVNNTLDAVIGPLNVAAEYVDRISKGDIPPKITDSYNGDFNEIKNNLNQCIEAVNLLVSDARFLAQAAVDGKQDTRADATKHLGDFRKIVEGVNGTLDAVIGPVKEAMRVAERYAKADFSTRVDEQLKVAGDFVLFKNSLNNIGIFVQSAIQEIQRISNLYAAGNFAAEFDRNLKIEGDLALLRDALDKIGMNVSDVLRVIAREMNQLSHQSEAAGTGIEDVSRGAELIAKNAEQTKQNAERSEDGINQVLQTMEDLTRTISEVSSNAERVAGLSVQANGLAKQGIGAAGKADKGMMSITKTSEEVESIFAEIRAQMHEIVKIVDLITDIANQTNLLSLNAAIEAARAGEAGKGFAVVAAEVKSLAQRSRQSAEHIADMISDLQKKSDAASGAMAEAGTAVAEGSAALSETLGIFNTLTTSVEDITRNMEMVASATEEQAASFEEITASVNEMSLLVKDTSKDALNSSATSKEALAVVDQITSVIGQINEVVGTIGTEMEKFSYKGKN